MVCNGPSQPDGSLTWIIQRNSPASLITCHTELVGESPKPVRSYASQLAQAAGAVLATTKGGLPNPPRYNSLLNLTQLANGDITPMHPGRRHWRRPDSTIAC